MKPPPLGGGSSRREDAAKYLCTSETNIEQLTAKGCIATEWDGEKEVHLYSPDSLRTTDSRCQYHTYQELSDKLNEAYTSTEAWNFDEDVYKCFVTLIRVVGEKVKESKSTRLYYKHLDGIGEVSE